MNKKGVIGLFIVFVLFSVILIFLFGFAIPILIDFNSNIYNSAEDILDSVNTTDMPQETQDAITSAKNSIPTQIDVLSFFFEYSWFIVLLVVILVIFLYTRTLVEVDLK